ncbi:MAG: VWA domain-containing protein [Gammaproteobacteria bacterium]|uniref:VWA domain-containing protein n=1 Tax=Xanthomonas boreopolis TaxID=86183 RepID=A0A919FCG4_9XANT|nr:VWA domain-containing protein [[Pseudomonas] boreopolis]
MFLRLFHALRAERVPVTPREWLDLLGALEAGVADPEPQALYALARTALVKDERHYDRFDRAFGRYLKDVAAAPAQALQAAIPGDWLRAALGRELTEEEKAGVQRLGSLEELMRRFLERLGEQHERHEGGSRWIGTGGTSPFGNAGHHPGGLRVGGESRGRMAAKVWEQRSFRELDGDAELSPRNLKLALRRLRRFARSGAADEFDLEATVAATAREGGLLDVRMRPERRNAVSVILLLDIGGSMDDHVHAAEALFGAARAEFKRLEHFYFHNFLYEHVWTHARRHPSDRVATWDLLHRYPAGHRVIVVGDASMHPYEISHPGGASESWNAESGATWFQRLAAHFPHLAWINPLPRERWDWTPSVGMVRHLLEERMFPLTPDGIGDAMTRLSR